ncbi:hypothetical protein MAA_10902 [Metarhizium robertsii ARSEF 23]|uniref:Transposase-like protein n=1 Tax=Metarhizium robertsii (strain ARSEF 23 / ATCC MYA-3075) TaxID=655844 RepID=A0A0B2XIQ5_METRA|nr:uncharacterized protein MAA_10902 [Metarhizium robertsii ARSEF 23]KHO11387.1 hypothetical protein MAA_10902 [Metarhizium robertsii ARSEF 23]
MAISHNRRLARDNDTRWNSWYTMLRAALNLRDAIDGYFNKWVEADCAGDELSSEDWITLEKINTFLEKLKMTTKALELEKLKMTTKALESSFATLDHVLLAMDFVLAQFEAGKETYADDPIMAPMYNSGWAKLDKYYRLTDESPAYVAAIVLHPSHKWHYIHENWKTEWVESSKELIETLWGEYKPVESPSLSEAPSTTTNEFLKWRNKYLQPAPITDEYEHYAPFATSTGIVVCAHVNTLSDLLRRCPCPPSTTAIVPVHQHPRLPALARTIPLSPYRIRRRAGCVHNTPEKGCSTSAAA